METRRSRRLRLETNATNLGDDLLLQILTRLPDPTSASRCKSVCKRWRSLISTPCFTREFATRMKTKNPLLPSSDRDWKKSSPTATNTMSFLPGDKRRVSFNVVDCFNDLLLCEVSKRRRPRQNDHESAARSLLLCNPLTKQWVELPSAPSKSELNWAYSTRLLCQPKSDNDDSEYRFKVVTIYQSIKGSTMLDVFCSESGEWTEEALVLNGHLLLPDKNVCSRNNGDLVWWCRLDSVDHPFLLKVNAFRLDVPPTSIDTYDVVDFEDECDISTSSQGRDLQLIVHEKVTNTLSVWTLEEEDGGRESWRMQCEGRMFDVMPTAATTSSRRKRKHDGFDWYHIFDLHPEEPEIVYFKFFSRFGEVPALFAYDMRKGGELEFVSEDVGLSQPRWKMFQPRVDSCWPTPIPRFDEKSRVDDGSCNNWFGMTQRQQRGRKRQRTN